LADSVHPLYGQCTRCGTLCLRQRPSPDQLKQYYGVERYWHEHQTKECGYPPIEERAVNDFSDRIPVWFRGLKELKPNAKRLLEIGCAHGGFLHHARENGVADVVGVEVDEGTCAFARERFNLPHVVSGLF